MKINATALKAVADPEVNAWALSAGAEMRGTTAAEFAEHLRSQIGV
jgi:hypothetical protein